MSQKIQPCSVTLEPIKESKEDTKKKSGKNSRQTTPVPVENSPSGSQEKVDGNKKKGGRGSRQATPVPLENQQTESAHFDPKMSDANSPKITNGKSKSKKEKAVVVKKSHRIADFALDTNGSSHDNGLSSIDEANPEVIDEESLVPNSEHDNDELFPELIFDEISDNDSNFDSSSPIGRSATRRSQVKSVATPETPQMLPKPDSAVESSSSPFTERSQETTNQSCPTPQPDQTGSSEDKVLKMKEMYSLTPANSSEPMDSKNDKDAAANLKVETNFSKSRIKISPYRRSARISDQYSTVANYSGNNSTQETDLVADISSSSHENSVDSNCSQEQDATNKSYIESLRSMKGRKSYRPLREFSLRNLTAQRQKAKSENEKNDDQMSVSISSVNATVGSETRDTMISEPSPRWTPVGHVIGRKRKQSPESSSNVESPALILSEGRADKDIERPSKRQRLFGYVATPLRNLRDKVASSTPLLGKYSQGHTWGANKDPVMMVNDGGVEINSAIEDQMPMVADVVGGKAQEEHKWCLIM